MDENDNWTIVVQRKQPATIDVSQADRLFSSGRSIAEVATLLGVAVPTLRRAFVRMRGVTPKTWLFQTKLQRTIPARVRAAEPLIAAKKLSIAKIAEIVGFPTQQALSQGFRSVHGLSPTKWRASNERHDALERTR